MAGILCNYCGKEIEDEDNINMCLSCGGTFCGDEFDCSIGFCTDCLNKGAYREY